MKTILLENGGVNMLYSHTKKWIESIDKDYIVVNSEIRTYMRHNDLYTFAMLIDPELTDLATMSAFPSIMGFEAEQAHGRNRLKVGDVWKQIEYYTWLIYEAIGFRKSRGIRPLIIHIAYEGIDFLKDVNKEKLGSETKTYLMLMMRQNEGSVILKLYQPEDGKLLKTITKESQLKFTR